MKVDPILSVAVMAPAGLASDARVEAGIAALHSLGLSTELVPIGAPPRHYLAGDDGYRADAIRRAWALDVDAIWALRGGFGCIRTLDVLGGYTDPRPLLGFSDVSALLAHAPRGWHAPVVTQLPNLDSSSLDALQQMLAGGYSRVSLDQDRQVLRPGRAVGSMAGGNLTVLASMCGTRWQPTLRGRILLLEDVGEPPYRVDRAWTQLRLSGALEGVRGLVIGRFTGVADGERETLSALFEEMAQDIDGPVMRGVPVGHSQENVPVPMYGTITFDTAAESMEWSW